MRLIQLLESDASPLIGHTFEYTSDHRLALAGDMFTVTGVSPTNLDHLLVSRNLTAKRRKYQPSSVESVGTTVTDLRDGSLVCVDSDADSIIRGVVDTLSDGVDWGSAVSVPDYYTHTTKRSNVESIKAGGITPFEQSWRGVSGLFSFFRGGIFGKNIPSVGGGDTILILDCDSRILPIVRLIKENPGTLLGLGGNVAQFKSWFYSNEVIPPSSIQEVIYK